ncbi:MAG: flavin reductase family protein [Anaerolineales bacterium]|jgi:flavin reductase (DIM6/NTAB) family NADH-FMN oxidoreductase RutF
MDVQAKKTALRMIPYGLFVLTARSGDEKVAAGAVNWVTQSSFDPPQVVVCVREDSYLHSVIEEAKSFALNAVGKSQEDMAVRFFKPAEPAGQTIGGYPFEVGSSGAPILTDAPAYLECKVVGSQHKGDHSVFIGEVVEAFAELEAGSRPDESILMLSDLEGEIYYGG